MNTIAKHALNTSRALYYQGIERAALFSKHGVLCLNIKDGNVRIELILYDEHVNQ